MSIRSKSNVNKITGVYVIKNIADSECYVGSSSEHIPKRWRLHIKMLKENRHHSIILQRAWNKYGEKNFKFETLEECPPENCINREQYYLDTLAPKYNICKTAGSPRGRTVTSNQKNIMRRKMSGQNNPFFGKTHSEETRKKISNAVKGKMKGVLVGEKNPMFRKTHSKKNKIIMSENSKSFWNSERGIEMKGKRSAALSGKSNPFALKGKNHPKYNPRTYSFYNNKTNESFIGTVHDFRKTYNLCGDIYYLLNGKYKQYKGWEIQNKNETVTK